MEFRLERLRESAKKGFSNATDVADYLVKKGMPFRTAHGVVGELVLYCEKEGKDLEELSLEEYRKFSDLVEEDIYDAISLESCVKNRKTKGSSRSALGEIK